MYKQYWVPFSDKKKVQVPIKEIVKANVHLHGFEANNNDGKMNTKNRIVQPNDKAASKSFVHIY